MTQIANVFIGDTQAERVYLGNGLVWGKTPIPLHRHWRVSGVVLIGETDISKRITMKELRFITRSGILSDDKSKAYARSHFPGDLPRNAFDGDDQTAYHPSTGNTGGDFIDEWLAYDFTQPVSVIGLTAKFRTESYADGWRFKSAVVEYSNDGNVWELAGYSNIKNNIDSYTFVGDIEDNIVF